MDMNGEMCPKKTNRWVHLNGTLKFYILCRRKIVKHTYAHAHLKSSSTKWWTIMFVVTPTINEINKTIIQLSNRSLIIVQQKIKIRLLKDLLINMFKVKYIKVEQDGNNNMTELDMPPVVPHELVKVALQHFISDVLSVYRPCLDHFWSKEETDEIEAKQHDLIK
ncbi:unnamed protein product [Sphagnum jensenii]|uniref:Uncharacterized protein n=1 Tax=Sphagnum jensenii TaxID=128206 RepID=A0ABP1AC99_9BRYO